jgi:hypothetical protein
MNSWGIIDLWWKDTHPIDNRWTWTGGPWGGAPAVSGRGWLFNIRLIGSVRQMVVELHTVFPPNPLIPIPPYAVLLAPPGRWAATGQLPQHPWFPTGASGKGNSATLGNFIWRAA